VGNENLVRLLEQQQQLNERLAEQQATLLRANSAANVMHNELSKIHINLFTGDYKKWPALKNIFECTKVALLENVHHWRSSRLGSTYANNGSSLRGCLDLPY